MVTDFHSDEDEQAIHDGAVLDFVQRRREVDEDYTLIFDTIARHVLIDYDPDTLTSQQSGTIGLLAEDVFDAIGDRLLPGIPDTVKRVQIVPCHWHVEFYYHAFPNDNGEIWQDFGGDYQSARFALAAAVCEIPEAGEWPEWNCYPDEDGWVCFADDPRGEIEGALPQGCGIDIPSAIRNALEGGTE